MKSAIFSNLGKTSFGLKAQNPMISIQTKKEK
jgi:hypothetical protein